MWQLGAGSGLHSKGSTSPPNRPPPGVPGSWTVAASDHPDRPGARGNWGPSRPREGRQILPAPGGSARNCHQRQPPGLRSLRAGPPDNARCWRSARASPSSGSAPAAEISPGPEAAPLALATRPTARQLGSAPAAPPPNCRVLRRMYSSGLQRYPSWAKRTRCAGPAPLLSRLGGGSRRRLRRSEHETAPALRQQRALSGPARAQRPKTPAASGSKPVWCGAARRSATLASLSGGGRGRTGRATSPRRSRRGPGWGACPMAASP